MRSVNLLAHLLLRAVFLDAPLQLAVAIKEEVTSRAGSDHGEEEMEVDSADEQEEEARSQGGQAHSQISKNNTGATFNTLSSLGSLRPGTLALKYVFSVFTIITATTSLILSLEVLSSHCIQRYASKAERPFGVCMQNYTNT